MTTGFFSEAVEFVADLLSIQNSNSCRRHVLSPMMFLEATNEVLLFCRSVIKLCRERLQNLLVKQLPLFLLIRSKPRRGHLFVTVLCVDTMR